MNTAQWTVLAIAALIGLIVIGSQGGKNPFALRAREVLNAMFRSPGS